MRTLVRAAGSLGYILGEFHREAKWREYLVIDPIAGTSQTLAGLHISLLSALEAEEYGSRIAPILQAQEEKIAEMRRQRAEEDRYSLFVDRESTCYACGTPVWKKKHEQCENCRWIICPNCGACGCRYQSPNFY